MTELVANCYGKSAIRLARVVRHADRHELRDFTIAIRFEGAYAAAYRDGDNSAVLATDTMKNTVYCLAKEQGVGEPEEFALVLGQHFLAASAEAERVRVEITEHLWNRIAPGSRPHPHAFTPAAEGERTAVAECDRREQRIVSGLRNLVLLKTTGSGFAGFPRDRFTSLPETDDRILATAVEATWRYGAAAAAPAPLAPLAPLDYGACWRTARRRLTEAFADHDSRSVQHTIWVLGEAVLEALPEIEEIHLRLPNRHHLPVDLGAFGMDGAGEIFVATEAPYGLIEGTLRR